MSDAVRVWRDDAVAHIQFNRPELLNAIDLGLSIQFRAACEALVNDRRVRAVVISAEGRAFMAGGDLSAMGKDPERVASELIDNMHAAIQTLAALPVPVIASVQGPVAGGGLGLVLSCDLCIAADDARFSVAYPLIGASADCATTWALPRLVGLRKALELAWLSNPLDATVAAQLGLVNVVVPREELTKRTRVLAQRLACGPTLALGRLKHLLRSSHLNSLSAHLAQERDAFLAVTRSADFREGVAAFLEKRDAVFLGA